MLNTSSELYNAATEALVSETSAQSTFEKMIQCAYSSKDHQSFMEEVKETEKQIKKDFEVTSMPNPWRSAKSVISSAMKLNIDLVDDNSCYYGKTFLQTAIKAAKANVKAEYSVMELTNQIIGKFNSIPVEKKLEVMTNVKYYIDTYASLK